MDKEGVEIKTRVKRTTRAGREAMIFQLAPEAIAE